MLSSTNRAPNAAPTGHRADTVPPTDKAKRQTNRRSDSTALRTLSFTFQNVRGMKDRSDGSNAKLDELLSTVIKEEIFAAMVTETWESGNHNLEKAAQGGGGEGGGILYLHPGLEEKDCNRGRLGVAIILGKEARKGFEKAGSQKLTYGDRIMAIRIEVEDGKRAPVRLFLVAAYAPTSNALPSIREEYYSNLDICINSCKRGEVLILGADVNASMGGGENYHKAQSVLGKWAGGKFN